VSPRTTSPCISCAAREGEEEEEGEEQEQREEEEGAEEAEEGGPSRCGRQT